MVALSNDTTQTADTRVRLGAALILLGAVMSIGIRFMWNTHPPDLSAIYMAGWLFAHDRFDLVYAAPEGFFGGTPPAWMPALQEIGLYGGEVLPYVYPPLWAALISPLAGALEPQTFFRAADIVLVCLLAASSLVAWRMARGWAMPLWAWIAVSAVALLTSLTSFMAMVQLQPHILVVFLTLLAFERYGAGRSWLGGALLGIAAALKLGPAALILIFLADRDWRALCGFATAALGCAALSLVLAGPDLHHAFLASVTNAVAGTQITGVTFSAEVVLNGIASALGMAEAIDMTARNVRIGETPLVFGLLGKLAMLAGLVWGYHVTAPLDRQQRLVARLFLLGLLVGLFGPLGWVFYFLPQIFLLPALVGLLPLRPALYCLGGGLVFLSWPFFLLVGMNVAGDFPRAALGALVLLALFVGVTASLSRTTGRERLPAALAA